MALCEGFQLVPLAETNVTHKLHPRVQLESLGYVSRYSSRRERQRKWLTAHADPMAIQAKLILRAALLDLREDSTS